MTRMNRRKFLQSIGAAALLPSLPVPTLALPQAAPVVVPFTEHTYQWAEIIARAHNRCNIGLLQRSLQVSEGVAEALKSRLIENGIISAEANAYGIHKATKPLYEGAFTSVQEAPRNIADTVQEATEKILDEEDPEAISEADLETSDVGDGEISSQEDAPDELHLQEEEEEEEAELREPEEPEDSQQRLS